MWGRDNIWRVRGAFDELEIELDPRPTAVADGDAISRTRRHLRALLEGLDDAAEARRVLLEIYTRVLGFSGSDDRSGASGLEAGSRYAQVVGERLDAAASMGRLVVRVIEPERAPGPSASAAAPVPIFKPLLVAPEPETSWIGLALVDQNETPVPGRPYRVVAADRGVYEGTLDDGGTAVVQGLENGLCRVSCPAVTPHPSLTYTVQDGDHISGIAQQFGFDDYTVVWNRPENADLRALRDDPQLLAPGDSLFIPELKDMPVSRQTGDHYTFDLSILQLQVQDWIRVRLFDAFGSLISESFPSISTFDLNIGGVAMAGLPIPGEVPVPPGNPSACTISFPAAAQCSDPVPAEPPTAQELNLDPERRPVGGLVTLNFGLLGQSQIASLNTTNVFQLQRRQVDVFEFEHFNDGSAVFLPSAAPATVDMLPQAPSVKGIDVLRACLEAAEGVDIGRMLAIGHGDTSQPRAENVVALLRGDDGRDDWVAAALSSSVDPDLQVVLAWVAASFQWPCDPSTQDPSAGDPVHQATAAFQSTYNNDLSSGLFPPGPQLKVDGFIGQHTWGAIFDCYMRALRPVAPTPSKGQQPYLVVDDQHMTYPAKLAGIAAPYDTEDVREQHWTDLNPLNPSKVIPNGGGWYPIQVGDIIYLPTDWDLGALSGPPNSYQIVIPPAPVPPIGPSGGGPPPVATPGPAVFDCVARHPTSPYADDDDRRAVQRHVEVVIVTDALPPPLICDGSAPCTAQTCELYDPRQVLLAYEPLGGFYDVLFDPQTHSTDGAESYHLFNSSGSYDQTLCRGDAVLHAGRLRLRFLSVTPGSDYALSQVLAANFEIPLFTNLTVGS